MEIFVFSDIHDTKSPISHALPMQIEPADFQGETKDKKLRRKRKPRKVVEHNTVMFS